MNNQCARSNAILAAAFVVVPVLCGRWEIMADGSKKGTDACEAAT
jgi:hypothetical protein